MARSIFFCLFYFHSRQLTVLFQSEMGWFNIVSRLFLRRHPLDNVFVYFVLGPENWTDGWDEFMMPLLFPCLEFWRNLCCGPLLCFVWPPVYHWGSDDWQAWVSASEADCDYKRKRRRPNLSYLSADDHAKISPDFFFLFSHLLEMEWGNESRLMLPPVYSKTIFISPEAVCLGCVEKLLRWVFSFSSCYFPLATASSRECCPLDCLLQRSVSSATSHSGC